MLTDTILRNRYKILKELGSGGFSVTYLAVDMDLPGNPRCVVKQLKTRNPDNTILQIAKKLFEREAQVLYRLGKGHKQIPEMFAHFEENDEFYLVQEFVDGHDLTKEVKPRHRLSEEKVVQLLEEILEVLSFVHQNNVIHRDIKLRNIMRRREDDKIVLIDFGAVKEIKGLSKNQQGDVNSTLIIGTPGYMPDEQANGKPRLCSDIYAVGMLGIQALTGISPRELPFNPDNGELIWLDSAKVSDRLAEVLTGMVRHHFSQRYQTAAEALAALKSPVLISPLTSSAYKASPVTLPSTIRKSHPPILQSLGLVGLMGVGFGLGVFGWNFFQPASDGNQPPLSEVQDSIIKNINPSVTPNTTNNPNTNNSNNNSNSPIYLPATPKPESHRTFLPFLPFFKETKTQVTPEASQSKDKDNQIQPIIESLPQPVEPRIPAPKTSTVEKDNTNNSSDLLTPKPQNNPKSVPSTSITPSPIPTIEHSPTSLPSTPQTEKEQNQNRDRPTNSPTPTELEDTPQKNPTTSLPISPESESKDKENPATPPVSVESEQPKNPTPASPSTPAIENESPSPKPTPSPKATTGSVLVPTIKPSETPAEESHNYFLTVPTSPTPENQVQPTFSPEIEVEPTPQTSASPSSSELEIQVEAEPTPQASAPPFSELEIQVEVEPTPRFSASPMPEIEVQAIPYPTPTRQPGLSLKRFAI